MKSPYSTYVLQHLTPERREELRKLYEENLRNAPPHQRSIWQTLLQRLNASR